MYLIQYSVKFCVFPSGLLCGRVFAIRVFAFTWFYFLRIWGYPKPQKIKNIKFQREQRTCDRKAAPKGTRKI
jgi:hypothetical protein